MWREGEQYRARMAAAGAPALPPVSPLPSPCPSPLPQREKEKEDSKSASSPSPALLSRGIAALSVSGNNKSVMSKSVVSGGPATSSIGSGSVLKYLLVYTVIYVCVYGTYGRIGNYTGWVVNNYGSCGANYRSLLLEVGCL